MKPTTCFAPAHILLPSEQVPLEQWAPDKPRKITKDTTLADLLGAKVYRLPDQRYHVPVGRKQYAVCHIMDPEV